MSLTMNYYFFDLDGTLEDSRQDMVLAAQNVRAKLGLPARNFDALVPHVNKGMRELYLNCFDDYLSTFKGEMSSEKLSQIEAFYNQEYGGHIAVHTVLYSGIREILQHAKNTGRTAVITNKPESLSKKLLDSLGVSQFIDLVVGGDTCAEAKPSALPLRHALKTLGGSVESDRVFMIGDSQGDSKAGADCGAHTVWCAWGYQSQSPTQPAPHHIAATPEDLIEIFNNAQA
jgi:phosphoglycolate phosphatase